MQLNQLEQRSGNLLRTLAIGAALVAMLYLGYQLSGFDRTQLTRSIAQLEQTQQKLTQENEQLTRQLNQFAVQLELAKQAQQQTEQNLASVIAEAAELKQGIAFYQYVMAPEMTQDGFLVDGFSVEALSSPNHYRLELLLVQQRRNKAVVHGALAVKLEGSLDGSPHAIQVAGDEILVEGSLDYRFKYFQQMSLVVKLPEGFIAEQISITSTVYQYKKARGQYEYITDWPMAEALQQDDSPNDSAQ